MTSLYKYMDEVFRHMPEAQGFQDKINTIHVFYY